MKQKHDFSILVLLLSNLFTAYLAITQHWPLIELMWTYWFQSVTIGIFNFLRMIHSDVASIEKMAQNAQPRALSVETLKWFLSLFFAFHYGFFHLGYAVFLLAGTSLPESGQFQHIHYGGLLISATIFFANHLYSYLTHRDEEDEANILVLFFYPYARIFPMHIVIVLSGFFSQAFLPLFLGLKILADIFMHILEHARYKTLQNISMSETGKITLGQ